MIDRILFVDDMILRYEKFISTLPPGDYICIPAFSYEEAIKKLQTENYEVLYLDHDLSDESIMCDPNDCQEKTGTDLAKWIVKNKTPDDFVQIICHSLNPAGRVNMVNILRDAGFTTINCSFLDLV